MACITIHCHEYRATWDEAFPVILFAYRASVNRMSGYSPFFLCYGREAPKLTDYLFDQDAPTPTPQGYAQRLSTTMQNIYRDVARRQLREQEYNRRYRDRREDRKVVAYQPGDWLLPTSLETQ